MTHDPAPRLSVQSDLELVVGDLRATLVSDGSQLTLHTADATALAREVAGVPGSVLRPPPLREIVGRVAGQLHDAGLAVRVEDDRGTLVEIGDGCRSRLARVLLRSDHVRFGAVRVLAPTAAGYVAAASSVRQRAAAAATGVTLAAIIVVTAVQRRHTARERTLL